VLRAGWKHGRDLLMEKTRGSGPHGVGSSGSPPDLPAHVAAVLVTTVIMLLLAKCLFDGAVTVPVEREGDAMQVFFITRPHAPPEATQATGLAAQPASASRSSPTPTQPAPANDTTQVPATTTSESVYSTEGRIRLPAGIAIDPLRPAALPPGAAERSANAAKQLLERRNPIEYRPTRFDKDWASDGTLGDVALQKLGDRLEGFGNLSRFVLGEDQPARARRAPEVRFNPALHERASDLGSEATGDAYKAAPIAFEPAPGLKGEASRRIRAGADDIRRRYAICDVSRLQRLLVPVLSNLIELEHVEYAMAHGVDPIQAEHLMPATADRAYDLARRALWYADRQLSGCAPSPAG